MEAEKNTGSIADSRTAGKLKEMIEKEGPGVLTDAPYEVFQALTESGAADRRTAAALFYTFLMGIPALFEGGRKMSAEEVSAAIQKECGLQKKTSGCLAEIYLALYSEENTGRWKSEHLAGMKSFMDQEWEMEWEGQDIWDGGQVYVDCSYEASITISPVEGKIKDPDLEEMLRKNPFLSNEEIAVYFQDRLFDYLDQEFHEHCTCDDYYPPVAEDFEAEYYAEEWCKKHGFVLVSFEGDGSTGDYEPKSSRWY